MQRSSSDCRDRVFSAVFDLRRRCVVRRSGRRIRARAEKGTFYVSFECV